MDDNLRHISALPPWLPALLPLLLAAVLTIPLLDVDAFNGDEPATLVAAGIHKPNSFSLADTWNYISRIDPVQAHGWPLLLYFWGRIVGWSEIAVRSLPAFFGLLAIASIFRFGRETLNSWAGHFAALLLSACVFFLAYMIHARAFTLITLFAVVCIWSYWRITSHTRPSGKRALAGLFLGSAGLLYTHYYSALLLPVLALFHLFFVLRNRRWWQPFLLFGLAILLAAPQLPGLLRGLAMAPASVAAHTPVFSASELLSLLARNMTNGLFEPAGYASLLLLLMLPVVFVITIILNASGGQSITPVRFLGFCATSLLLLSIIINEAVVLIAGSRIRYLISLWPMASLLAGAGFASLPGRFRPAIVGLVTIWVLTGAWLMLNTDLRYKMGFFLTGQGHESLPAIRGLVPETDFLVMDYAASTLYHKWFWERKGGEDRDFIYRYKTDPLENVRSIDEKWSMVSLVYHSRHRSLFAGMTQALNWIFCERVLDVGGITLDRYTLHSISNCPQPPVRLAFDSDIQLTAPEITIRDGLLRLDVHFRSVDETLLARYSLAVHVFDQRGQRIAQGDVGVGPGAIVPLRSEVDISALPPGDYEMRVALYDWQTGARLSARDTETDVVSDMHAVHRFRLG